MRVYVLRFTVLSFASGNEPLHILQLAEPALTLAEREQGLVQLVFIEIGPQRHRRGILRVRGLPDQEIREAHLARGANDEVGIGQAGAVKVIRK